MKVPVCHTY